ncbi:MAG: ERF family protein [Candidatus Riflebacteria bacterium]|nr:ERF family protein [Candidatus Riflebacteria bacterium]
METSQTIGKISEALAKAQGAMKPATMDAENPYFKSKYATLAAIMEVARPALSANGIAVIQGISTDGDPVRVSLVTMLVHASGEWISSKLSAAPAKADIQGLGAVCSYLRRYALASMIGAVADQDDDGNAAAGKTAPGKSIDKTIEKQKLTVVRQEPDKQVNQVQAQTLIQSQPQDQEQSVVQNQISGRVAMIKEIFKLSAAIGQTPLEMKAMIGKVIGLDRPIRESSEIPNAKIEQVLEAFRQEYLKHVPAVQEVAA